MLKKVLIGTMVASQLVTAQMARAFTVSVDTNFFSGLVGGNNELFVGHEEITRQALVILSEMFKASEKFPGTPEHAVYLEMKTLGLLDIVNLNQHKEEIVSGANSENPIIQGNYATDMPGKAKKYPELGRLTKNALRLENSKLVASYFKEVPSYAALVTEKYIPKKSTFGRKMVGLADLNDQQAYFIKILTESIVMARMHEQRNTLRELRANAKVTGVSSSKEEQEVVQKEKATRKDLVPQIKVLIEAWGGDWHNNPEGQITHFLRNYINMVDEKTGKTTKFGLASARDACASGRSTLIALVRNAVAHLPYIIASQGHKVTMVREQGKALTEMTMFLLGHATHMLQDSFSGEHTRRALQGMGTNAFSDIEPGVLEKLKARKTFVFDGKPLGAPGIMDAQKNNDILDICFYGEEQSIGLGASASEACYHKYLAPNAATAVMMNQSVMKGDFGDSIWTYGEGRMANGKSVDYKLLGFVPKAVSVQEKARVSNLLNRTLGWQGTEPGNGEPLFNRTPRSSEPEGIERWGMINHNARLARTATVKLLYTAFKYIAGAAPGIRADLKSGNLSTDSVIQIMQDAGLEMMLMENVFTPGFYGAKFPESLKINWNAFDIVKTINETSKDGEPVKSTIRNISKIMPGGAFRCELLPQSK